MLSDGLLSTSECSYVPECLEDPVYGSSGVLFFIDQVINCIPAVKKAKGLRDRDTGEGREGGERE